MSDKSLFHVEGLCKSFGNGLVLDHISTDIEKGEVVVIIGPSGSGKSTFLRSLNLLEMPTGGKIYFEGNDITDKHLNIDAYRQKIGMVFQHFNLFPHMTILKNLTLAPMKLQGMSEKDAKELAMQYLERVGLSDKADAYPSQLSGGQKQRIAIVRALCMNPEVLLFDEPTSALDPISTLKIEDLMDDLREKYTVIIVTHNMQQAARIADKTAFFLTGEIVEYTDTQTMFNNPKDERTERYITGRFG